MSWGDVGIRPSANPTYAYCIDAPQRRRMARFAAMPVRNLAIGLGKRESKSMNARLDPGDLTRSGATKK